MDVLYEQGEGIVKAMLAKSNDPRLQSINLLTMEGNPIISSAFTRVELTLFAAMSAAVLQSTILGFTRLKPDEKPVQALVEGTHGRFFLIKRVMLGDKAVTMLLVGQGETEGFGETVQVLEQELRERLGLPDPKPKS